MAAWVIALIVIGAVVVLIAVAVLVQTTRRRALRDRFGPEYDRMVAETGSQRRAASVAKHRVSERRKLDIHPLSDASRDQYAQAWRSVQAQFVDTPTAAVGEADALVTRMMRERGYPIDDFEHQASLVSVDHPLVVDNYREGHRVYVAAAQGAVSTEEMRRGFVAYRSLFEELLSDQPHKDKGAA